MGLRRGLLWWRKEQYTVMIPQTIQNPTEEYKKIWAGKKERYTWRISMWTSVLSHLWISHASGDMHRVEWIYVT